jgi:hypothetical protein
MCTVNLTSNKVAFKELRITSDTIHNDAVQHKVEQFMTDNNMTLLHRDPTDLFQKQLQKAITQMPDE